MEKRKKAWLIGMSVAVVVAASLGAFAYYLEKQKEKQALDYMNIVFEDAKTIEYGSKQSAKGLIKKINGEVVTWPNLDTMKLGEVKLTYTLTYDGYEKKITHDVLVEDHQKPVITFKKDRITMTEDEKVDIEKNIASVSDKVDGKLALVKKKEYKEGTYYIEDNVDVHKAGSYQVDVYAKDKNGLEAKKSYEIVVKEKPVAVITPENPDRPSSHSQGNNEIKPTYINGILLVNKTHPLPPSYGGVDPTAYAALEKLQRAANKAGHAMPIISGYRSYQYQVGLYNSYVERDGQAAADRYSARPGTSEHQTGLAYDIGDINNNYGNTPGGKWLEKHCAEFGFIIRFPKGKEHITGYMYEPWHVRYVGKEHAKKIMAAGICLEEYLGAY